MKSPIAIAQMLVRLIGAVLLVLGVLFWTGNALTLVSLHMFLGLVFVLLLWAVAVLVARAGVPLALPAVAIAWGVIVLILGLTQDGLVPGPAHWTIQVLHVVVGLGGIALAEVLAARGVARLRSSFGS